ncbi:MAG TPA: NnrS family protein [Gammaproteobacteria bacterium]|nr:NnrS family protein [Gammaproteobacteria bacterium]
MLQIEDKAPGGAAWLRLGFRPFFLAAIWFGALVMLVWALVFARRLALPLSGLAPIAWHGHEMIFGYAVAVIAGFLLTAVRNWTGLMTLRGPLLGLLLGAWLVPRLLLGLGGAALLPLAAIFDLLFVLALLLALARPILRKRNWAQAGILLKILLLGVANGLFYLGAVGVWEPGLRVGLYSGLYLVLALILMLSRRVLPFFIERGVGYAVTLRNRQWLDISSLVLFLVLWLADLWRPDSLPVAVLSLLLLALHGLRLAGWYTAGIWRRPLLWSLYLAYVAIVAGFGLKAAVTGFGISPYLALHAFAVGGIGLMTAGMMARVALGHTGRDIGRPPAPIALVFGLLLAAGLFRVLLPLLDLSHYRLWVEWAQGLWVLAFVVLGAVYTRILLTPRVDGRDG